MAFTTLLLFAFLVAADANDMNSESAWGNYKVQFGKTYTGDEEVDRRQVWQDNMNFIRKHNEEAEAGDHTYTLAENFLSDMTEDEIQAKLTSYPRAKVTLQVQPNETSGALAAAKDLPVEVNWVREGIVTRVKNQYSCHSSYAFAVTGVIESHHALKTKDLIPLSEQNLIDCATFGGNQGCDGGSIESTLGYVFLNHGIDTEQSYPYQKRAGPCRYNKKNAGASIKGYIRVEPNNEEALKAVVAQVGPVATMIDARRSFYFYGKGVLSGRDCSKFMQNQAVLIVGYGTHNNNDYWLVKNSWGDEWGQKGYFKMARNKDNACGIASEAFYPLM